MSATAEAPEDDGPEIEIEIEDEEFEFDPDTLELVPEAEDSEDVDVVSFGANLVPGLDDADLEAIGSRRQEIYTNLKNARSEWEDYITQGIRWLGLSTEEVDSNMPTEDSCTAVHPLLMENVVKFQAKAIQELWPAKGPVRTKIKGYVNAEREATANRVRTYMNYQLTEQVPGFYNDLERNLFRVGFMGTGIRKSGWSDILMAPDPTIVAAENFYVDPTVSHLRHADEYIETFEITKRTMDAHVASLQFAECEDGESEEKLEPDEISSAILKAQGFEVSQDRMGFLIGESHCYLDLEGADPLVPDGGSCPYVVHFNVKSGHVYAIRRNWREGDPNRLKIVHYTADIFIPAFGFYGLGYLHLIGALTASSSAALRALVDSGQFANWQAGFKSKDAKFSDSDTPLAFGEWRDVDLSPEEFKNAFLPLPAKEPSQILFALLQFMVASGQKFADATDEVVQNGTNYGPAATTLAMLEASQRFYSSVHKRLHQSQHEFFGILGRLNFENLPAEVRFVVGDENQFVKNTDFNPQIVDILPASDPNSLSESQRVAKAQIELETAARFPQLHDLREALRRFYSALGTDSPDKLLPVPGTNALSADPLSELQAAMTGKPIKAQLGQNHTAHIAVKEAFLKSPQMQGTNDPTVSVGLELLKSNISEHKVLMFVAQAMQVAQQTGQPIQDENVQAQIANVLVQISAQSGGAAEESVEQQMIQLNRDELEVARQRLESQDARESAKLAQKNEELVLKRLALMLQARDDEEKRAISSAGKILDNATKMTQIRSQALTERVANQSDAVAN